MDLTELARSQEQYYISATEPAHAEKSLILKQGDTFAVVNRFADTDSDSRHEEGIYHGGTRFLSRLNLTLMGGRPLLLSSTVRRDNVLLSADLTNPDIYFGRNLVLPRGTLHLRRSTLIWNGSYYERIRIHNYEARRQVCLFRYLSVPITQIFLRCGVSSGPGTGKYLLRSTLGMALSLGIAAWIRWNEELSSSLLSCPKPFPNRRCASQCAWSHAKK